MWNRGTADGWMRAGLMRRIVEGLSEVFVHKGEYLYVPLIMECKHEKQGQ